MAAVKRLWNLTFKMICFLGFSYQLQNIILSYFRFGTVTKTQIVMPEFIGVPALHYCFLCLQDLINISAIERKYRIKSGDRNTAEVFGVMDHISIGDMLEFTPNDPIENCIIRDDTGNTLIVANNQKCNSVFKTTKYIIQQYVCYQSVPIVKKQFRFGSIVKSLDFERMIYDIRLKKFFDNSRKVRTIITNWRFPLLESVYAPAFYKTAKQPISIMVSCNNITANWLGYPYDHFICQKDGEIDYFQCRDTCLEKKTFAKYGRLPFTSFYQASFAKPMHKLISARMLENATISQQLNKWQGRVSQSVSDISLFFQLLSDLRIFEQKRILVSKF